MVQHAHITNHVVTQIQVRNHMIILKDIKRGIDKFQQHFMIKVLKKQGLGGTHLTQ